MNRVRLSLLQEQLEGLAEEMGSALARCAFSPNIRLRRDFSCALFTARGELLAQAAHIPVHLGSMPGQVKELVQTRDLKPAQTYLANDPYQGGTHLPDLTLLEPVFEGETPLGIVAVRAHHADIGGTTPGSMGNQRDIFGEGLRIPLTLLREGQWNSELLHLLLANMRAPADREGDLLAQSAACRSGGEGLRRLYQQWASSDQAIWLEGQQSLITASAEGARRCLARLLPSGQKAHFEDALEYEDQLAPLIVGLWLDSEGILVADFEGTSAAVPASINATLPVTEAALAYVASCLFQEEVSINEGLLQCLRVRAPEGCLVNARFPSAVAAGNVETSQAIVDVLLGALAQFLPEQIPAASAGSMNNLSFGTGTRVHYETAGGGCGGHPTGPGSSALQVHMTNTRATPVEVLEEEFPLTVVSHSLRAGSGGAGLHQGGEGTTKVLRFAQETTLTLLATRRQTRPYGLRGGQPGAPGQQAWRRPGEEWQELPGSFTLQLPPDSEFRLETPGGGGWGEEASS